MNNIPPNKRFFSPDYWDGHDIHDDELFKNGAVPGRLLDRSTAKEACKHLRKTLGRVATGESSEISYRIPEFNPDIQDGSLIVLDREKLIRITQQKMDELSPNTPAQFGGDFERPYGRYWLRCHGGEQYDSYYAVMREQLLFYARHLLWGVVMTERNERFVQPFEFTQVRMLQNNTIKMPKYSWNKRPEMALLMPVQIAQVNVFPVIPKQDGVWHSFERIRSVDVIYQNQAPRNKKWKPAKSSRRFAQGIIAPQPLGIRD